MSEATDRARDELAFLELCDELEAAREAFHEDRENEDASAAFRDLSNQVAAARAELREKYPRAPEDPDSPDGNASPDTIEGATGVKQ